MTMDITVMIEMDAERWETIARLHANSGMADANDFWLDGTDELCENLQPNRCNGCPVKDFTGRANCDGHRHWHMWADATDAYLGLKGENDGHELGPVLNGIAHKAASKHGKTLAFLAKVRRERGVS